MRMILTKGGAVVRMTGSSRGAIGAYGAGRTTAQRRAVATAAARYGSAFTAEDLAARVRRESPGVATATVYRSISAMAATGYLARVGERDGAALYVRCDESGHHHHVVCVRCGATAHAPCPVTETSLADAVPDGFVVTSHEVNLYGICAACCALGAPTDGCSCDPVPSPAAMEG